MTALVIASMFGFKEIVKILLPLENDVKDGRGFTASCYAESVYDLELWSMFPEEITKERVRLLENAHISPCVCEKRYSSLIQAAKSSCLQCAAKNLCQAQEKSSKERTALMGATKCRRQDIVSRILAEDEITIDQEGITALIIAAFNGHIPTLRLLAGREAGMKDTDGRTAIMYALRHHQIQAVGIIAQHESELQSLEATELIKAVLQNDPNEV